MNIRDKTMSGIAAPTSIRASFRSNAIPVNDMYYIILKPNKLPRCMHPPVYAVKFRGPLRYPSANCAWVMTKGLDTTSEVSAHATLQRIRLY
jgi:hypothetical protein